MQLMTETRLSLATRQQYKTLLDAITLTAENTDLPAIIYLETEADPIHISRADFRQHIQGYGSALQRLGVGERDLVIIAHTQNLESIFAFWGAMLIGAIPSMFPTLTEKLDPDVYMHSMAQLVEHSQARCILTTDDFAPQLATIAGCPVYGSEIFRLTPNPSPSGEGSSSPTPFLLPPSGEGSSSPMAFPLSVAERGSGGEVENAIAFLQHSSGTTGLQKGVALSHAAVLNQVASYSDSLALNAQDVIVSWLPLYHDMGLIAGFIMPLVQGIPLVLMSPFDWVKHPAMLFRAIHDYQGTYCWLPNFAYNHCARRIRKRDTEGLSLASIRAFINCSEPVHHSSHVAFVDRFAENGATLELLAVSYAMAENTFAVTQSPIGEAARLDIVDRAALESDRYARPIDPDAPTAQVNVSCGAPIAGVEVRIVDEKGGTLPERAVGEVAVKSSFMLSGYYRRPDLNEKLWVDGWYLTGDMGYITDGEVYISGRKKDLIINGGKNVYPQDLEAIVNAVPGVHPGRAVAFGVWDERDGTELIGIVAEVDTDDPEQRQHIAGAIREAIATQTTVTASYVYLVGEKWLLKTSSGKIARAANRDKWLAEREAQG